MQVKAISYKHLNNIILSGEKQDTFSAVRSRAWGHTPLPCSSGGGVGGMGGRGRGGGGALHFYVARGHTLHFYASWGHTPSTSMKWHVVGVGVGSTRHPLLCRMTLREEKKKGFRQERKKSISPYVQMIWSHTWDPKDSIWTLRLKKCFQSSHRIQNEHQQSVVFYIPIMNFKRKKSEKDSL